MGIVLDSVEARPGRPTSDDSNSGYLEGLLNSERKKEGWSECGLSIMHGSTLTTHVTKLAHKS